MTGSHTDIIETAKAACDDGRYADGGVHYTRAGQRLLSAADYTGDRVLSSGTNVGYGLYCLTTAAVLFRVAGEDAHAENRIRRTRLAVDDYATRVFQDDALDGLAREYRGDLAVVGGDGALARDEYDAAEDAYATVPESDHVQWMAEPVFEWNLALFQDVVDNAGIAPSEAAYADSYRAFGNRLDLKRDRFERAVNAVVDAGTYKPR